MMSEHIWLEYLQASSQRELMRDRRRTVRRGTVDFTVAPRVTFPYMPDTLHHTLRHGAVVVSWSSARKVEVPWYRSGCIHGGRF